MALPYLLIAATDIVSRLSESLGAVNLKWIVLLSFFVLMKCLNILLSMSTSPSNSPFLNSAALLVNCKVGYPSLHCLTLT